ncbi:MAG: metallophosphoesterase [Bacteroidota bacterium]
MAVLLVDIATFYWLRSITRLIVSPALGLLIHVVFWVFTMGLIGAIVTLRIRLDSISSQRKHRLVSSLFGLSVASFVPKIIFVVVITILYFANFVFSEKESIYVVPIVGTLSGFLPFFVILYAVFGSLYRFKVYRIKIVFEQLPKAFDGLRLVQISDIHLGSFNYKYHVFDKAVRMINNLKPDYIFFTGDLVNNYSGELQGWESTFEQLKAKSGKFSVLGNHDYGDYSEWESDEAKEANFIEIKGFHQQIGFELLLNDARILQKGDDRIALLGIENWGNPPFKQYGDLQPAILKAADVPFKILLSHDPTHWVEEVVGKTPIALTLSGHTHGMQAGIQFKDRRWSPIKYKYKHWAGLYKEANQFLYVNRGLGWLGFPGRIGMRPEITLIQCHRK